MIKKIIAFALCFVLCVSCIALGVINQKADDTTEDAADGAIGGVGSGAVENVSTEDPATTNLLSNKENNLYELPENGTITITKANADSHATYQALLTLLDGQANGTTAVTLDGKGCTIKTEIGLFKTIGNVTIKNLNIESVNEAGITVTNGDFASHTDVIKAFGVIAGIAKNPTDFENVTVDVDVTYTGNAGTNELNVGAFVGKAFLRTITNCVNDGNVTVTPSSCGNLSVGGFLGYQETCTPALQVTDCINNGKIVAKKAGATAESTLFVGGIAGTSYGVYDVLNRTMNTGDIEAEQDVYKHIRIGGLVGHYYAINPTDCINLGDIDVHYTASDDYLIYSSFMVGGILGSAHYNMTVTRCFNAGDIKCTTKSAEIRPSIAGIVAWRNKGVTTFTDCVNIGDVSSTVTDVESGICSHNTMDFTKFVNCYSVAFDGEFNTHHDNSAVNSDRYYITIPASVATLIENAKTKQMSNGAALIAAVLAVSDYDSNKTHVNDDGIFLSTFDGFTIAAGAENGKFVTEIDKDFYEDVAAIVGNVEFGGIVTLSEYVDVIGEFTHEAFKDYLDSVKTPDNEFKDITALYMNATFEDGRAKQTLTNEELAGDKYVVNVTLLNAEEGVDYVARTFIKIGENAYIYSK